MIPAHILRNAALRLWRTRQALAKPQRPIKHSVKLKGHSYHQTRGSRFVFHVDSEISCWDAWTGVKIGHISAPEGLNHAGRGPKLAVASICRSPTEIYLAVLWRKMDSAARDWETRGVLLQKFIVTIRPLVSVSNKDVTENTNTKENDGSKARLAASFSAEDPIVIRSELSSVSVCMFRFGGQYLAVIYDKGIQVFDWENLRRKSFLYRVCTTDLPHPLSRSLFPSIKCICVHPVSPCIYLAALPIFFATMW